MRKGIACIVVSAFGFALMAAFVRLCDDYGAAVSCFQKGFFRNAVALIIAIGVFCRKAPEVKNPPFAWRQALPVLFARCAFGAFGLFANFYAISHIQVGEAMALNKTAPFFTVLFSWLLLGEKATWRQLVCLLLAFVGAMLVIKPGVRVDDLSAALLGLAGGFGAGIAYVCVHRLGRMNVPGSFIVLVFSAFSCVVSIPFALLDFQPMTWAQIVILLLAGVGAAIGQFGITAAYRFAEPRAIAAFDYTGVVFSALFGFLLFDQIPDGASVLGFAVIVLAALRLHDGRRIARVALVVAASGWLLAGCRRDACVRTEWTTMGTIAAIQTRGADAEERNRQCRDVTRQVFDAVSARLNAHDPTSELRRLASQEEGMLLQRCSPEVSNCYAAAFRLMRESGGAFNPRWRGPSTMDLGAIAKGFAADCAAQHLAALENARSDVLIDLGGNLKCVAGVWKVGIAGSDMTLVLTNGMACATSAEYFRGKHIHDGRTGCAVSNAIHSVTVVHPTSAMLADGLSTTLFVLGRDSGEDFLRRHHPEAFAIWTP